MPDDNAASEALEAAVAGPRRMKVDNVEAEQQPLADLIAADRHLASRAAASRPARGLRITKLVPPGAD